MSGAVLLKLNNDRSGKVVRVQDIPDHLSANLPSEDEMWSLGHQCEKGWYCAKQHSLHDDEVKYVHRCPDLVESGLSPPILEQMRDELSCQYIAMFASDGAHATGSLEWHIDGYHVFAFNIEGVTEWEWFDLGTGKIKSVVLEPKKNIITMPSGISHRVKLLTEHRMSVSIIKPASKKDIV